MKSILFLSLVLSVVLWPGSTNSTVEYPYKVDGNGLWFDAATAEKMSIRLREWKVLSDEVIQYAGMVSNYQAQLGVCDEAASLYQSNRKDQDKESFRARVRAFGKGSAIGGGVGVVGILILRIVLGK